MKTVIAAVLCVLGVASGTFAQQQSSEYKPTKEELETAKSLPLESQPCKILT